jgi:hypothetical protein
MPGEAFAPDRALDGLFSRARIAPAKFDVQKQDSPLTEYCILAGDAVLEQDLRKTCRPRKQGCKPVFLKRSRTDKKINEPDRVNSEQSGSRAGNDNPARSLNVALADANPARSTLI